MATPPSSAEPRRWSLTARLFGFYTVSTVLFLAACLFVLLLSLEDEVESERDADLRDYVSVMTSVLSRPLERGAAQKPTLAPTAVTEDGRFSLRLVDPRGRVLLETEGMGQAYPTHLFPAPTGDELTYHKKEHDDERALLLASIRVKHDGGAESVLQIAAELSDDDSLVEALRARIGVALVVGAILASAAGAWVVRSALRPMTALARVTEQVTPTQLRLKLNTRGWPREAAGLADAMEQMLARIEEAFTRLAEFSTNLSHEFRTPIYNLRGETELALSKPRTSEEYREVLLSSLEEYERLSRLIEALLFLARVENADIRLKDEALSTATEFRAVVDYYEAVAAERGVEIRTSGDAALRSEATLLRRVLANLVDNALKHTPAGGKIELTCGKQPDGRVEISVTDTGEGIPPQSLERIYQRFYRVNEFRSDGNGGFGLGLAIVRSIMLLHQGELSVESTLGSGTRVRLVFPVNRAV